MNRIPKNLANLNQKVLQNHPLSTHTYMKVGGPAKFCLTATTSKELIESVKAALSDNIPFMVLGGGSNILFQDDGFQGLVILNRTHDISSDQKHHRITADSGVIVNQLVNQSIQQSLAGLEEFLGIPGTVGGAVYNNSHHLKHLMGDYIDSVEALDTSGKLITLSNQQCKFAYDYSIFQDNGFAIISATFQLKPGDKDTLYDKAKAALKRRRDTQPLESPSSGCMFKNIGEANAKMHNTPNQTTAAGYLIDKAGLKGLKVGGASVSQKHANFIVNDGSASSKDVINLSNQVIQKIKQKYGVTLEREVFIIDPLGK